MKSIILTFFCIGQLFVALAQTPGSHNRPQTPKGPFPYHVEEVNFTNIKDSVTLAGTLTLPAKTGKYPVVVLISGSGPQDRDEELFGHRPFLIIADYLTRRGIGVLRYDDRGTARSTGNFRTATSVNFAGDALAAVTYLKTRKEINKDQIGLAGHSEGGIVAPIVAANNPDIAFVVLMAAPGIPIPELLDQQSERLGVLSGTDKLLVEKNVSLEHGMYEIIMRNNTDTLNAELSHYLTKGIATLPASLRQAADVEQTDIKNLIRRSTTPWFKYFLGYKPEGNLSRLKCPVLVLNGALDAQVLAGPNLAGIKKALEKGKNKNYKVIEYERLNHLFQEANTGSFEEYETIEGTISVKVLQDLVDWIGHVVHVKLFRSGCRHSCFARVNGNLMFMKNCRH